MRLALLLLALGFPTLLTWVYFLLLAGDQAANPVQQGVYVFGKIFQFALPVLDWFLWERRRLDPRLVGRAGVGLGLGFGIVVGLGLVAVYHLALAGTWLLADTAPQVRLKMEQMGVASPLAFLGLAVFLSLVHSALEEYYWRWYAFGRLREVLPIGGAALVGGLAFMSHHVILLAVFFPDRFLVMVVPLSLAIAVGGIFWAWLYQRSGSLLGPWLSHAVIDGAIFIVAFDLIRPG